FQVWRERRARRERVAELRAPSPTQTADEVSPAEAQQAQVPRARPVAAPHIVDHRSERKQEPEQVGFTFSERTTSGPYVPPDVGQVFQLPPEGARRYDRDSLIMNSRILEKKLADFGVQGRVVTVHPGPVITMYEFEPAPGVKVNRITNLSDDLALALRALSIRIIAPIPGKSVVGIEVPNYDREVVYIRDLLESKSYRASASKLTLALGKDIFGNPFEADLSAMPHVLVAGATGTGKSVFLNSLLCSILCRATPDEAKLLLVDPKLLELSVYEGIPHLIADVVTNPKRAAAALQGIVQKMEERYQLMAALGVRNIAQFNRRVEEALAAGEKSFRLRAKPGEEAEEAPYQRLPYIVVVIDELADLMVVSARDVEESLQRLAQMARAAGIHLVLATQRPSVDVLTGVIKANFPARISFQVSSKTDSRTILDQSGAEHLLGQGDMLFLPPGTSKLQRLHGSFVSEREVTKLVEYLRTQGEPRFDEDLIRMREESEALGERDEDTDEHYDMAVAIVAETRNASISYIQRRLKVGYNRAARMIEQMEREGVVGPQIGMKPREVHVRPAGADVDVE
ncbi:MAG: DNA translocase FtsK, partial [Myxococcota bacterium]